MIDAETLDPVLLAILGFLIIVVMIMVAIIVVICVKNRRMEYNVTSLLPNTTVEALKTVNSEVGSKKGDDFDLVKAGSKAKESKKQSQVKKKAKILNKV